MKFRIPHRELRNLVDPQIGMRLGVLEAFTHRLGLALRSGPGEAPRRPVVRPAVFQVAVMLLAALFVGSSCGGDFLLIINTGTVVTDADCRDGGGSFELRESGGLTVLVIITSNTAIVFASGGAATCDDIIANTRVSVRGSEGDGTIRADRIQLGAAVALPMRWRASQGASTSRSSTSARSV